jgi:phosphatidyl-myo-inositol dimannoside synthase
MKVLLLTPSLASAGGIQRYSTTFIRAFKDLLGDQYVRSIALPEPSKRPTHNRLSTRSKWRCGWQAVWQVARWKPDLIVCTHVALGPIGWLLARFASRPCWVVVHGIEAWCHLPFWKRIALSHAERVIVTSVFSCEQVVKRQGVHSERISSLPCTLDDNLLTVEPARNGVFTPISSGKRVVLTVARMVACERYKGHDVALRAWQSVIGKIPNLIYVVVGDGDDRPRLEKLTEELGLMEHVVFTGEVSDSELAALYHRTEIFVLPVRTVLDESNPKGEGFGIVFLEAMAFGKPVIGPNYGAPVELIRHGKNGLLVDPDDPVSVAKALIELLENPNRARTMGEVGRVLVRRHYSYGSFRDQLQNILAVSAEPTIKTITRSCES